MLDREIGRGGMATVFLARDVRYDRKVAVKVLSQELGAVLGAERFLSEIRVTATLQHPNLLPLFDSGESAGLLYYVMPFVEGETLRARLDREKQLSVADTVRLGSAIASALDYAHRNGVIHRDLKPENILLQDGQPLVADFGIALAVSNAGGARVTQTGLSLGTPQYMSPEQATGDRTIDARSDVYALGAILYECLTGEPPHTGTTAQAIIARLMTEEPRTISATRKSVPAHVEAAIATALQKLPADRWASARELGEALQEPLRTAPQHGSAAPVSSLKKRAIAGMLLGAIVIAGGTGYAAARALSAPTVAEPSRFEMTLPAGVGMAPSAGNNLSISPDGRTVIVVGESVSGSTERRLYVRHLDSLDAYPLPGSEGATNPVISPVGDIVFVRPQGDSRVVVRLPAQGGAPTTWTTVTGALFGGAWSTGEFFVFAPGPTIQRLARNDLTTKVIADITSVPNATFFSIPFTFPDGRTVGARIHVGDVDKLALVPIDSGPVKVVDLEMSNVVGYRNGTLVYGKLDGWLYTVPFDLVKGEVRGVPERVLGGITAKSAGGLNAVLADNGTLALLRGVVGGNLQLRATDSDAQTTLLEMRNYRAIRWSPDGKQLAVEIVAQTAGSFIGELWRIDPASGAPSRVSTIDISSFEWSADGKQIAFSGEDNRRRGIFIAASDGSVPERLVLSGEAQVRAMLRNGSMLLIEERGELFTVSLTDTASRTRVSNVGERAMRARVSPDEQWVAYLSDRNGRTELFVKPLAPGGGSTQVSLDGAADLAWASGGRQLFFRSNGSLRRATISTAGNMLSVTQRDSLFPVGEVWDMNPVRPQLATMKDRSGESQLQLFIGWAQRTLTGAR
ncbi:MAG: protein kinase [Gemmatimonas sp.]|nr:protein kinase [Gemmatimonas sp.]